jgi:hypothetical protein
VSEASIVLLRHHEEPHSQDPKRTPSTARETMNFIQRFCRQFQKEILAGADLIGDRWPFFAALDVVIPVVGADFLHFFMRPDVYERLGPVLGLVGIIVSCMLITLTLVLYLMIAVAAIRYLFPR